MQQSSTGVSEGRRKDVLDVFREPGDEGLRERVAEDKLRAYDEDLRSTRACQHTI